VAANGAFGRLRVQIKALHEMVARLRAGNGATSTDI
jgi:hypothetical protein